MSIGLTLRDSLDVEKVFIKTGSTLLDYALGGGYLFGRIINIIGDQSTGKTLLALQGSRNMQMRNKGFVVLDDAETALDEIRAVKVFRLDPDDTFLSLFDDKPCSETVEDFYKSIIKTCRKSIREKRPCLYVIDSLDALGTEREMEELEPGGGKKKKEKEKGQIEEDINERIEKVKKKDEDDIEADFSMRTKLEKAQKLSDILRRINKQLKRAKVTLIVISQTRSKIGIMFGDKTTISGGKALMFYASQRIKLAEIKKISKGKKIIGIWIRAKIIKNKVAEPFHVVDFPVYFNKGIDDLESCVVFLRNNSKLIGREKYIYKDKEFDSQDDFIEFLRRKRKAAAGIRRMVKEIWEKKFAV